MSKAEEECRTNETEPNPNESEERKPIIVILDKFRHKFVWTLGGLSTREVYVLRHVRDVSPSSHFVRFRARYTIHGW